VVSCPPNSAPNLAPSTSQTNWITNEGDSLCFPITFTDPNGDSVFFNATGNIFSNPPTNPPAMLTPNPNSGAGTVTSQFCWDLACNQTGNFIFIVQVPDNGCPPKITNTVFTIQVLPYTGPAFVSGPTIVCENTTATYSVNASSGASFNWSVSGGSIASGQGTNIITVNWGNVGNGTVNVTSFNQNGCPAGPIKLNVSIQSKPLINAGPDATLCKGASVTLNAQGGGTYSWSPSAGLSNPNISNPVATPTVSTAYIVTVTSALNCSNTDTVNITVNQLPVVNAGLDVSICIGSSSTIGGNPTGPPNASYNWSPSTGLNSSTLANPVASPTITTNYTVVVTDVNTCTNIDTITVTVNQPPVANAGNDVTICPGTPTTLNGTGGGTYNWSPSSSLSNPNISNPVASPTTSTTYTLIVTQNNCSDTDFVSVTTLPLPAVSAGTDVSICMGNSTTLSATGTGTFVWSPSTGLSCTTCTNPITNPTSTTNYTLTITDANSCTNTDVVQVTVNPLPQPNAGPRPGWVCPGFSTTLNASNGITYVWSPSSSLNNPNVSNPVASPTVNTQYTVNATDANGCSNWDTLTVLLAPTVPTNAGNNVSICIGQSVTLGGNPTSPSPNTVYSWSPSFGLNNTTVANPVATPTITTTYTVFTASDTCNGTNTVTVFVNMLPSISAGNDVSICAGDSVMLTASSGILYSWSTTQTSTSITVSPTSSSSYTVIGTDANGCSNKDSVTVFVHALPSISAGNDVSICAGDSVMLTASGGILYSWSTTQTSTSITVSPTSSSTYTVIGIDANGCSNIDTAMVFVLGPSSITTSNDTTICIGDSAYLFAAGGTNYTWSPSSSLNNSSIANPIATPTVTTTYTVTVVGTNGCINSDTVKVVVNALPNIDAGNDTLICSGSSATLNAQGGISYSWSTSQITSTIVVSPTFSSSYTVIGTDANGCSNMDAVVVSVGIVPTADFELTLSLVCEGIEAQFLDSSLNATAWEWNFGDGAVSTVQNPAHSFNYGANYVITLIAHNPPCSDTIQKTISISGLTNYLSFQNANVFTPNHDGINDCFNLVPEITGVNKVKFSSCATLTIYDRWGVPVYHSAYPGACWDGTTTAGLPVSEGTYFFVFDINGIKEKGFITVLR
jgi:gliding motility-associated-like protein